MSTKLVYLLKKGDRIGDYTVIRPLGAGGMGEVYLVEHQHLRKRYALKILPSELAGDETFIARFRIEARVMADLEHPGIVRVHNFGHQDKQYYLVMDYVSGPDGAPRTLDDELAWGKKLDEHTTLEIAVQLCDALEYAHTFTAGSIVHRDLKPGNILIRKDVTQTSPGQEPAADDKGGDWRIKIADFGLARIVGTDYIRDVIDRSTNLTAIPVRQSPDGDATEVVQKGTSTISMLGTYDYMSPEQKAGESVGPQSDLYAVGLILYRMLTGHKPEGTYEPPSRSGAGRHWDPVIAKCLERSLEKRYASAADLRRDLLKMRAPLLHRVPRGVLIGGGGLVAAAALFGLVSLFAGGDGNADSAEDARDDDIQLLEDGTFKLSYELDVRPAGGHLSLWRDGVLVENRIPLEKVKTSLSLQPGVYEAVIEKDGYRKVDQKIAVTREHERLWAVELERVFGFVKVPIVEGRNVVFHDAAGNVVEPVRTEQVEDHTLYKLPHADYDTVISMPRHEPASQRVAVRDNVTTPLNVSLQPLPGSLRVTSAMEAFVVEERGRRLGVTGEWIRKVPSGTRTLTITRDGYRPAVVEAVIPADGEVDIAAPELIRKQATLVVSAELVGRFLNRVEPPSAGTIQIDGKDVGMVNLPWTGIVYEVNRPLAVTLEIASFRTPEARTVELLDAETETVRFSVVPLPIKVTIESSVPADVYRYSGGRPKGGLSRFIFGRELPVGKTGEPIEVEPGGGHGLTVVAEGYEPADVTLPEANPGESITLTVELKPAADAEPSS